MGFPALVCYRSRMANEGIPAGATPTAGRPARPPRSTPDLVVELQVWATSCTLAAIAVANHDVTQLVCAIDDDSLGKLNTLTHAG